MLGLTFKGANIYIDVHCKMAYNYIINFHNLGL